MVMFRGVMIMKTVKYNLKKILLEDRVETSPRPHWAQEHIDAGKPIPGTVQKFERGWSQAALFGDEYADVDLDHAANDFMDQNPHLKDNEDYNWMEDNIKTSEGFHSPFDDIGDHFGFKLTGDTGDDVSKSAGTYDGVEHDVALANLQNMVGFVSDFDEEGGPPYTKEHAQDFAKAHSNKSAEEIMYDINQFENENDDIHTDKMISRIWDHKKYFDANGPHSDKNEWHDDYRWDQFENEKNTDWKSSVDAGFGRS